MKQLIILIIPNHVNGKQKIAALEYSIYSNKALFSGFILFFVRTKTAPMNIIIINDDPHFLSNPSL